MNKEELMLYLYRDVGLYWEKELSLPENKNRLIFKSNEVLKNFIKIDKKIVYEVSKAQEINNHPFELNFFYMTTGTPTRVGSLINHLRNSIMHGNYKIINKTNGIVIEFFDENKKSGNIKTMKGSITLDNLKNLIDCTKV